MEFLFYEKCIILYKSCSFDGVEMASVVASEMALQVKKIRFAWVTYDHVITAWLEHMLFQKNNSKKRVTLRLTITSVFKVWVG